MAQFVGTAISIDGKTINQFSSLTLSQGIFEHHHFRLVCPAEAIDGTSGNILNKSKDLMGAVIAIQVSAIGSDGVLQFAGVVTQVEAARYSGHTGDIIISGYSPTIVTDDGPNCKTWEKKALKNIARDVLQQFPQNMLPSKISPVNSETFSYTVQYKETAWQFLKRLSAQYGEWFFYNGEKLMLGLPQGNKADLIYGSNLDHFSMSLQVRPTQFEMMAYDYMNHEVYNGSPNGIDGKAGLNDLGRHALQKSKSFYGNQPKQWHNQFLTNKKQLDDYVNTRAAMQSSNMVRFNGSSGHPGVQVGGSVSVQGRNVFSQSDESFGDYTVITVHHHCDGQGNYSNDFIAIPASIKLPPVHMIPEPHCETQSALVTDNHDDKGLGRVRVKFHWMSGSEKSPWLRVTTPHAGGGKGLFLIPEVGEEVIVGFEGNSATKSYIIGSVYHGKAKCDFSNGGNDVKALQSRSGNKVVLNDKDGSIFIEDKSGNCIMIDGAGNIIISSSASIAFACGGDGKNPASFIGLDSNGKIILHGKEILLSASDKVNLFAGSEQGGSGVGIVPDSINIAAKDKCGLSAGIEANIGSATLKLSGDTTNVAGNTITVNGNGDVKITGGLVKINS